ncbi:MAG: hypothetical protein HY226_00540 [Candidatus Vogelbacteria bacterium]|nr:hypothetical protein [Candidatus Vogelbacteria bacterium]
MKEELQKLITDGQLDSAFNLFKEHFAKDQTTGEPGQILTHLFEAYINSINSVNKEEEIALEDVHKVLSELKKADEDSAKRTALEKAKEVI